MVFLTGSKNLYEIVEIIADALIAGYANWSDGDTAWTTADPSDSNARRCLLYTGDTADIYIALEVINQPTLYDTGKYGEGLRITFSSSWDDVGHTYPISNMQTTVYPVGRSSGSLADLEYWRFAYYIWYEENGFVLFSEPKVRSDSSYTYPFMLCIERTSTKEYQDSQSNFWCYNECGNAGHRKNIIRPFVLEADPTSGYQTLMDPRLNQDNNKVYCAFPLIHNTTDNQSPIFQSDFIIEWEPGKGLVSGDVISLDGDTKEYLIQELKCSIGVEYTLRYGIKMTA